MKFIVLVAAAAGLGAVATTAVPSSVIDSGVSQVQALGNSMGGFKLADLNPLRAIFDWEAQRIKKPLTPDEMGFHPSAVAAEPYSFASPGYDPQQFNRRRPMGQLPPDWPR